MFFPVFINITIGYIFCIILFLLLMVIFIWLECIIFVMGINHLTVFPVNFDDSLDSDFDVDDED